MGDEKMNSVKTTDEITEALRAGYHSLETVSKTGTSTVYSGTTGTSNGEVRYSVSCTAGILKSVIQYYDSDLQTYEDLILSKKTLTAGESVQDGYHWVGKKIFRIVLSGATGRGTGSIQGFN